MKKVLLALIGVVFLGSLAVASIDNYGSERPAVWRSSRTCSVENFVPIATGTIQLHAIIIESPTVNIESYYSVFNGTQNANGATFNFNIATAASIPTNAQTNTAYTFTQTVEYDMKMSSGIVVSKTGGTSNACINLLWDYVVPNNKSIAPWAP